MVDGQKRYSVLVNTGFRWCEDSQRAFKSDAVELALWLARKVTGKMPSKVVDNRNGELVWTSADRYK